MSTVLNVNVERRATPAALEKRGLEPRRFRPRLSFGYLQDLHALVQHLADQSFEERVRLIRSCIDTAEAWRGQLRGLGVGADDLAPTIVYLASLRVLRDLTLQGWEPGVDDDGVYVLPPSLAAAGEDPSDAKTELRNSFRFAMADQLLTPSVATFVQKMEHQGIAAVFADGPDLAQRIEDARAAGADVAGAIRPVLELVDPEARDAATGIRLQDIWRYSRLQWSIPYQSTPGRNLHYLIRDEAGPNRPIIGIAALGNAILGLNQRDDALGWSVRSLGKRLDAASPADRRKIARHLVAFARDQVSRVYARDFALSKLSADDKVRYLESIEAEADVARKVALHEAGDQRTAEYELIRDAHNKVAAGKAEAAQWVKVARTQLYRRKRAANLADSLRAIAVFERADLDDNPLALRELLWTEEGRRAVEIVLRRIKQQAIAENVMEIITCGAVSPYQQLLGGKLVAMLMTSPQVVADVRKRYDGKVSLIASGMAGRPIVRTPSLSVLTTSSLYAFGSAQYNRVRIPGDVAGSDASADIRYRRVGSTDSFGTVQFASDTTETLAAAARLANSKRRLVNNLFGEGMSPKLRSLRLGLDALGLAPDEYLRHHSPRLLYAVPLVTNVDDVMLGLTRRPKYVLPVAGGSRTTSAIAAHWAQRWLAPRLERTDFLTKLRTIRRDDQLLSRVSTDLSGSAYAASHFADEPMAETTLRVRNSTGPISFVERLYRNRNSYADKLTLEELEWIHVGMGLDDFIIHAARDGRQIIVTGNPGDGKTFLIQRLRERLEGEFNAVVITDANAESYATVLAAWRSCDENTRAFVLAINEWPLFELRHVARQEGFEPVDEAVRQVQEAVYYGSAPEAQRGRVSVVDLNLRNVLAPRVTLAAVERLTDDRFVSELDGPDPATANVARLRTQRVQQRLAALLEQAARRGQHTTMRQLMGYIAFLVTGGTDSTGRLLSQKDDRFLYANLAFDGGEGPLFDLVQRAFDPARVTHPVYDEELWRGTTDCNDWLDPDDVPVGAASCPEEDRERCFRMAKRRFFFEHAAGAELLRALPHDEEQFDRVLEDGLQGDAQLVRDMVLAVNRFYEPDSKKDDDNRLTLWQSHRYDVQAPAAFVAMYYEPADGMKVEGPSLASWVSAWLDDDLRRVTQFALRTSEHNGRQTRLLIDRELYLTLRESAVGLGRSTWSRSVARKVTRFVDELHRLFHEAKPLSDLEIRNVDNNLRTKLQVRRDPPRYQL
ncbi:MAG: Druantia anti-phage system protein DruA [Solirubrobacteraceae bacterium]